MNNIAKAIANTDQPVEHVVEAPLATPTAGPAVVIVAGEAVVANDTLDRTVKEALIS